MTGQVVIEGLTGLRRSLREAQGRAPRELTAALKRAGEPIISEASSRMPRRSGALAGSLTVQVRGTSASIISRVPYGGGAEWGRFGKWAGFARYGSPPRFVSPALEAKADEVVRLIAEQLEEIVTVEGWFHGGAR